MTDPTDIVIQLRQRGKDHRIELEAADEIERLREEQETYFRSCDKLLAQTIELRSERDEARREVCDLKTFNFDNTISSYRYADLRKWDCYKKNAND
jgi:hypothetical protein